MTIKYALLRKQIFDQELKQIFAQVKQFGLLLIVFLGTAVPVLFFVMLLGFGIVLNNKGSALGSLIIVWGLLLTQSVLLLTFKKAILGSEFYLYLSSLNVGKGYKTSITVLLTLYCHPLLLIHVFILASIDPRRWVDVPHGFVFLALQIICTMLILCKESTVYWFLGLSFLWLGLGSYFSAFASLTLIEHLYSYVFLCMLSLFLPSKIAQIRLNLSPFIRLWMNQFFAQHGLIQFQISLTLLVSIMTMYCNIHLPQYASYINFLGAQIIVLASSSVQLMVNRQIARYTHFFHDQLSSPTLRYYQYLAPVMLGALMLFVFLAMQQQVNYWFVHMLALIGCIAIAKKWRTALIFGWLVITSLLVAVYLYANIYL